MKAALSGKRMLWSRGRRKPATSARTAETDVTNPHMKGVETLIWIKDAGMPARHKRQHRVTPSVDRLGSVSLNV
jgi:hypothetical protein